MDENFLLGTPLARRLFHDCAKDLPIIDYHNHLNMDELAHLERFDNLARLWLVSDPYKHRAMRICGVDEKYITGAATDREKFDAWMEVLPRLIGNPLYDWSIMEMDRIFGIDLKPGITDPAQVWEEANRKLAQPEYSPFSIFEKFQVEYAAPCALLTDDLSVFQKFEQLAPSLRCDNLVGLTKETVDRIGELTERKIDTLADFQEALHCRLDVFDQVGCKFADHALDNGFVYETDDGANASRFQALCAGQTLSQEEQNRLFCGILTFLASEYAKRGWTMQLHIGAQRYTSSRLRAIAGPAGGFAGIGSCCDVKSLTSMLDCFEKGEHGLPRVILFTLNPADNAVMSVLSGSYSESGVVGKVQQGPAWWWCDHLYGMREVFENLSSFGVLSTFVGMTTDSRSILSFVRHEYYRRAICGWIGEKVERGEFLATESQLKQLVKAVCYENAKNRM